MCSTSLLGYVFYQFARQLSAGQTGAGVAPWFSSMVKLPLPSESAAAQRTHEGNILRASAFLQARLVVLATIGALAPFIGLFGTVIGIMRSFEAISVKRGAGIDVVGAGIAEALICTAAGLGVAVLAVLCYNIFRTRMRQLLDVLELIYLDSAKSSEVASQ